MTPPPMREMRMIFEQFRDALTTSAQRYQRNVANIFTYPQGGTTPETQALIYQKHLALLANLNSEGGAADAYVWQTIELFEQEAMSARDLVQNYCSGEAFRVSEALRSNFGDGGILSMRIDSGVQNGFAQGDTGTANRLLDLLAGVTRLDLV